MAALPEVVRTAWENHEGPVVFSTVDGEGNPNAIYATCVRQFGEDTLVVADNFFNKTRANILSGSKGSLLFITKEGKSYQVKGRIEYHTEGAVFEAMKQWNPSNLPGHAAAALHMEHIFSGGEQLV
jgi:predicted pyridoxine 5'-phosphate oxidase superfamily flavin-nucleotide-binding protein